MKKEVLKAWKKRGMALGLSLVMLLGSGIVALAASTYTVSDFSTGRKVVYPGDIVNGISNGAGKQNFDLTINGVPHAVNSTPASTIIDGTYWANSCAEDMPGGGVRYKLDLTTYVPDSKPASDEGTQEPSKKNSYSHRHAHSYRVVIEPTETEDGLGQSRCDCGDVEWEQVIPSGLAWVKNILSKIENAEENGVVEIETNSYTCYTKKIIEALQKRPDVTLKTVYTDKEGNRQGFTIPAGQTPTDGAGFYGFTYLGNLYGWDELD